MPTLDDPDWDIRIDSKSTTFTFDNGSPNDTIYCTLLNEVTNSETGLSTLPTLTQTQTKFGLNSTNSNVPTGMSKSTTFDSAGDATMSFNLASATTYRAYCVV